MSALKALTDFVEVAKKNRKYVPVAVSNFRPALKLLESELTDEEKNSVDLISEHLDEIFAHAYSTNKNNISASSLQIYKKRIQRLISDYKRYGDDPQKMASWSNPIITRKKKEVKAEISAKNPIDDVKASSFSDSSSKDFHVYNILGIILKVPTSPTVDDAVMSGELSNIRKEIKNFAEKFINENPKDAGGVER